MAPSWITTIAHISYYNIRHAYADIFLTCPSGMRALIAGINRQSFLSVKFQNYAFYSFMFHYSVGIQGCFFFLTLSYITCTRNIK